MGSMKWPKIVRLTILECPGCQNSAFKNFHQIFWALDLILYDFPKLLNRSTATVEFGDEFL